MEIPTGSHINAGFRHGIEGVGSKNLEVPVTAEPLVVEEEAAGSAPPTAMADNSSSESHHPKTTKRVFGLSHLRKAFTGHKFDPFDYKKKYEEDEYGKEWDANARVWRVYLDEAQIFDLEMTEGWKDTLDVFLVFAGLFSAVVATFLGVSVQALQPDYGQITASLLTEIIELQRAVALGRSPDSVSPSSIGINNLPSPQTGDRWVNALWFISLTLALCTALIAVLIKQWIQQYTKFISGTPIEQVRRRQFKYNGLEQWGVPVIIGLMPLLLHASLFLYLAGLVVFTLPLDETTGFVVCGITAVVLVAYFVSNLLPLVFLQCPYTTPVSIYAHDLVFAPLIHLLRKITSAAKRIYFEEFYLRRFYFRSSWPFLSTWKSFFLQESPLWKVATMKSLKSKENDAAARSSDTLEMKAVVWLHSISSNPTVSDVALEALSALPIWIRQKARDVLQDKLQESLSISLGENYRTDWGYIEGKFQRHGVLVGDTSMTTVERLARAMVQIAKPWEVVWTHRLAYRMLWTAGRAGDSYAPELVLLGYLNAGYDQTRIEDSDDDRVRCQALLVELKDVDSSVWTSCIRCLIGRTTQPMSQYTIDSYQTPPLLSLLNLIPAKTLSDFTMPRSDYAKWSLLIRYMITCFYPLRPDSSAKEAQLCNCLAAYSKHGDIDIDHSSPEHRGLTTLLFCHLVLAFIKARLISPERIRNLWELLDYIYVLLATKATEAPVTGTKQRPLLSGSPRSELAAVVRKLMHKVIQHSPEVNHVYAGRVALRLFSGLFGPTEVALEDVDYFAWLQVMHSIEQERGGIKCIVLDHKEHIKLMEAFARFIETSTRKPFRTNSDRAPENTHTGRHSYEILFTQKNILSLYQVLASYRRQMCSNDEGTALKLYTQQLLRISVLEGSKSTVNVSAFSALRELLYNSPDHEEIRFNGTHGSVYIHALMTKLQNLDPQRGGFDKVNEDGTLQFAVYRKVRRATEEELSPSLRGSLSSEPAQFVKGVHRFDNFAGEDVLESWIIEPMNENILSHIFESSGDTEMGKGSWRNLSHRWRKAHPPHPV